MIIVVFVPLVLWIFWAVIAACWWTLKAMIVVAALVIQGVVALVQRRRALVRP